jgi:hypothetical protein
MLINEDILREITQIAWQSIFGIPLESGHAPDARCGDDHLMSRVDIRGAWDGAVVIRWTPTVAHHAAQLLYEREAPTAEEVRDLVGEIANVVGGNLKGLLPGPSWLSLPVVANSEDRDTSQAKTVHEAWFQCAGEPIGVRVVELSRGAHKNPSSKEGPS